MTFGPGKYDKLCTLIRRKANVADEGGGVLLIIIGGNKGPGFSIQADFETSLLFPRLLEECAAQMRKDIEGWVKREDQH